MTGQEEVSKPRKEECSVRLSSRYMYIARKLALKNDAAFAEVLNKACERGLIQMANEDNQMNIWDRTSAKKEVIDLVDGIPQEKLEDAIELLRQLKS